MNVIDTYRTFHPKVAEYAFISSTHGTFSRVDCMLGQQTSLDAHIKHPFQPQHWLQGKKLPKLQTRGDQTIWY